MITPVQQQNTNWWLKLNGVLRFAIVHGFTNLMFPTYLVNEYPKSGGTWLAQMLAEVLQIPFPRNRLPLFGSSMMHGHYFNAWNIKNAVVIWRDGRDVLISQYYHYLFNNERNNSLLVKMARRDLKFDNLKDIQTNLTSFMKYVYVSKKHPRFSWSEFVNKWYQRRNIVFVKYEDLRLNPVIELKRVIRELSGLELDDPKLQRIVNTYSFERLAKRKSGTEKINSFMRKGIVGDWRNYFSQEAKELFAEYAGNELVKLDYEKDYSWVAE